MNSVCRFLCLRSVNDITISYMMYHWTWKLYYDYMKSYILFNSLAIDYIEGIQKKMCRIDKIMLSVNQGI